MKHLHKFASVLLALVMAFSLMAPAFAAEGDEPQTATTGSITINNATKDHTYNAYQIFSGELSYEGTAEDGDAVKPVLSNVKWGSAIDESMLQEALGEVIGYDGTMTAADVADILSNGYGINVNGETQTAKIDPNEFAQAISKALKADTDIENLATGKAVNKGSEENPNYVAEMTNIPVGYYLVKDVAATGATGTDADVSLYMLQVVGPAVVVSKVGTPTPDKGVKDVNDSENTATETYDKTADHDIGDIMDYQLKATLPANFSNYKNYKLTFTDTMSKGLTLVTKTSQPGETNGTKNYTEVTDKTTNFNDVITVKVDGREITTGYTVEFKKDGENSVLEITFADVKAEAVGAKDNSVITIDYKALLNENAVVGSAGNKNELVLKYPSNPNVEGDGKPEEGETPPVTVIVFTYKAVVNKTDENKQPLAGAEFTLSKYDGETKTWVPSQTAVLTATEDVENVFTFKGLDDGYYRLEETKTPTGYNTIAPLYFEVEATHDDATGTLTELNIYEMTAILDKDGNVEELQRVADGTLTGSVIWGTPITTETDETNKTEGGNAMDVVNQSGATLPETGGIGTTIFYVVGGLLTVGAVVLLVTKKRMSVDSDK